MTIPIDSYQFFQNQLIQGQSLLLWLSIAQENAQFFRPSYLDSNISFSELEEKKLNIDSIKDTAEF